MGAIVASVFVTIVAIVGVIYFNYQDKKQAKKVTHKYTNKPFLTRGKSCPKKPSSLPKGRVLSFSLLFQFLGAKTRSFFPKIPLSC